MCSPAVIAQVAQTGVGIASSVAGAEAQDKSVQQSWQSTVTDLEGKYNSTQLREQQEMARTQLQVFQAQKAGNSLAARVRVQSAEGNVSGRTAQERGQTVQNNVTDYAATAKVNLANELRQNQEDAAGFLSKAQSQINQEQPESGLALGLGIAGQAIGGEQKAFPTQPSPAAGPSESADQTIPQYNPAFAAGID